MLAALLLAALSGTSLVWYDFESDGIDTGEPTEPIVTGTAWLPVPVLGRNFDKVRKVR